MKKSNQYDVVIVGAGINGLMVAYELVKGSRLKILILDRQEIGRESSWAGGGIISPLYPWRYLPEVTTLSQWSQNIYPSLIRDLAGATGVDPQWHACGLMILALQDMDKALSWNERLDGQGVVLNRQEIARRTGELGLEVNNGLFFPHVANVRNPELLKSLIAFLSKHSSVTMITDEAVTGFETTHAGHVSAVDTKNNRYLTEKVVICAGAWSQSILNHLGITNTIEPVRGQMLMFAPDSKLRLEHMILADGRYLIPRRDGRILVGSTLEKVGFDKRTIEDAYDSLLESACKIKPSLSNAIVEAHWSGLRPGSRRGVPIISETPNIKGLFVNAGQFRNGLVLAPASARLTRNLVLGEKTEFDASPYHLTQDSISLTDSAEP